jgi:hypothetical protein
MNFASHLPVIPYLIGKELPILLLGGCDVNHIGNTLQVRGLKTGTCSLQQFLGIVFSRCPNPLNDESPSETRGFLAPPWLKNLCGLLGIEHIF